MFWKEINKKFMAADTGEPLLDEAIKEFHEQRARARRLKIQQWLMKGAIIAAVIIPLIIGWVMR